MWFMLYIHLLIYMAITANAIPIDQSPASPLIPRAPDGCSSPACILVTFADMEQLNINNANCYNMGKEVRGVLVADCVCALWANWGCTDNIDIIGHCPGVKSDFKKPVKAISCGGWRG